MLGVCLRWMKEETKVKREKKLNQIHLQDACERREEENHCHNEANGHL